jgi:hypothetical protein
MERKADQKQESRKTGQKIRFQIDKLEERIAPAGNTGRLGYEGHPGNQGNGTLGYEGHPGNQGGH